MTDRFATVSTGTVLAEAPMLALSGVSRRFGGLRVIE